QQGWGTSLILYHILGIYTSILFYRVFWHRLNCFPGPFLAKLSNFYVTWLSAKKLQLFEEAEKLHRQYGDYVRIGPTELSITDPAAVKWIHSSQAKVSKSPWYTVPELRCSLHTIRDKPEPARRRKVWDQGFTTQAQPRISRYTEQLLQVIEDNVSHAMDMTKWFNYYAFDVMGDLSFGRSFDMLIDREDAPTSFMTQLAHRGLDERIFERPEEFVPERWTTNPELVKEPSAFFPFGGGKQLALMELRRVTAEILTRYEVSFAEGQTTTAFLDGRRDAFTLVAAPLNFIFERRK
ncbi:uncharacterized protein N7482_005048, partial [Penicillium canariense]